MVYTYFNYVLRCLTRALRTDPMPVVVPFWYHTSALLVNRGLRLVVCNDNTNGIGGMNAVRSTIEGMAFIVRWLCYKNRFGTMAASYLDHVLTFFRNLHDDDKHEFKLRLKDGKQTEDDICIEVYNQRPPHDLRMELRLHGQHLVVLLPEHLIAEGTLDAREVFDRYGPEATLSQQHECHFLKSILTSTSKFKPYKTVAMPVHGVYLHHGHRREVGFRRLLSGSDEVVAVLGKQYLLFEGEKEVSPQTLHEGIEKYREQDDASKKMVLEQVFGKKKRKWMYLFIDGKPNTKGTMTTANLYKEEARRTRRRKRIHNHLYNQPRLYNPKGMLNTGNENQPPVNANRSRKANESAEEEVPKGARIPKGATASEEPEKKPRKHASPVAKNNRLSADSVGEPFRGFVQGLNRQFNEYGLGLVLSVQDETATTLKMVTKPEKQTANKGAPCFQLHLSVADQREKPRVEIELPSMLDAGGDNNSCHLMKVLKYVERFVTLVDHAKSITLVDRWMDKTMLDYLFHERVQAFGERGFELVGVENQAIKTKDDFKAALVRWADTKIMFKRKEIVTVREAYDAAKTAADKTRIVALLKEKADVGPLLLRYRA